MQGGIRESVEGSNTLTGMASDPPRILAVDDEPAVLAMTARILKDLGYPTVTATSCEDALTLLRAGESVQLIVTDLLFHGTPMQGGKLASIAWEEFRIPSICVTGYLKEAKGFRLLRKPFTESDLDEAIRSALSRRRA